MAEVHHKMSVYDGMFLWGGVSVTGKRRTNEDADCLVDLRNVGPRFDDADSQTWTFVGLFDGHGTERVSQFCAEEVPKQLVGSKPFPENMPDALKRAFCYSDKFILRSLYLYAAQHPVWPSIASGSVTGSVRPSIRDLTLGTQTQSKTKDMTIRESINGDTISVQTRQIEAQAPADTEGPAPSLLVDRDAVPVDVDVDVVLTTGVLSHSFQFGQEVKKVVEEADAANAQEAAVERERERESLCVVTQEQAEEDRALLASLVGDHVHAVVIEESGVSSSEAGGSGPDCPVQYDCYATMGDCYYSEGDSHSEYGSSDEGLDENPVPATRHSRPLIEIAPLGEDSIYPVPSSDGSSTPQESDEMQYRRPAQLPVASSSPAAVRTHRHSRRSSQSVSRSGSEGKAMKIARPGPDRIGGPITDPEREGDSQGWQVPDTEQGRLVALNRACDKQAKLQTELEDSKAAVWSMISDKHATEILAYLRDQQAQAQESDTENEEMT
ncbi:hypothetical protein KIPB_009044, partial [Kipferlia bialata]|eukprot:g9044.t1